jgi:hypothetical protein
MLILITLLITTTVSAALAPEAQTRLIEFLETDCYTNEGDKRTQLLTGIPESALWEVYQDGVPPQQLEKLRQHAKRAYADRQRFLRTAGSQALPKDEIQRQLAVTEAQYVQRRVAQKQQQYRETALSGLAVIGTSESIPRLQRIASDEKDPASTAAQAALAALRRKY